LARGKEFPALTPDDGIGCVGAHIVEWFAELTATRGITAIVGMGGGDILPDAINHREIEAWAALSRNDPQPWEIQALRAMDTAYIAARNGKGHGLQHQEICGYCNGSDIEKCRKQFGAALERVCSTCPE